MAVFYNYDLFFLCQSNCSDSILMENRFFFAMREKSHKPIETIFNFLKCFSVQNNTQETQTHNNNIPVRLQQQNQSILFSIHSENFLQINFQHN